VKCESLNVLIVFGFGIRRERIIDVLNVEVL